MNVKKWNRKERKGKKRKEIKEKENHKMEILQLKKALK